VRLPLPSAFITEIAESRSLVYTILEPSGDQAGELAQSVQGRVS
jgi:hypothetical protein